MKLLIAFAVIAILAVAVGGYLWYSFSQPLYKPGMVREEKNLRGPLAPPEQTAGDDFCRWRRTSNFTTFPREKAETC